MATKPQESKARDGLLSSLNAAIGALDLAKEISSATPAKAVFGSVSVLLTLIKVCGPLFHDNEFLNRIRSGFDG